MYSLDELVDYLRINPKAKNSILYDLCCAVTPAQKGSVRKKKSEFMSKYCGNIPIDNEKKPSKQKRGKLIIRSNKPENNGRGNNKHSSTKDTDIAPTDPKCIGMTPVELIKYQLNKKMMGLDPDLKVIETFIKYTDKIGEFETVKPEIEEELGFQLRDRDIKELVGTALDGQLRKSLLPDEQKEFSYPSETSLD